MWDLIVSVPDHCLSFYFGRAEAEFNILRGPYTTDCHCQCCRITLLTAILKDNVKTMCG